MAATKPVMYRITAPETTFKGEVGGCQFANGVYEGPVAEGPLAYFTGAGYGVEETKSARHARTGGGDSRTPEEVEAEIEARVTAGIEAYKAEQQAAAYDAMTNDELKSELAERGLTVSGNHAELVTRLIEADEADKAAADAAAASDNGGQNG